MGADMPKRLGLCLVVALAGCIRDGPSAAGWNRNGITQLSQALGSFKAKFGYYPPSRIKLSETCNYPQRDQPGTLDADSVTFLRRTWPQLDLADGRKIDWNGDAEIKGDWTLEGDECLVFFLGGVPVRVGETNGYLGFSTDPRNPMKQEGASRVGPFYNFDPGRLIDLHGRRFFSYLDPYGQQPYAYFSAACYDRNGETDCPSLGVWPYARALQPQPRFWNPDSFQIISAGPDGRFGPGTKDSSLVWTPAGAGSIPAAGRDDMSNFYDQPLGVPGSP
jgi:hypothetical protein